MFTGAVARCRALERLREFRQSLYECLDARADALFELADAVLCADHAVTSLVQLCLEPEFTRGHGALYDALSAGRIDDERLFSLLAAELPQAVDGPEARAWIAEHDVIDHGLLEKALAGLPGGRGRAGAGRVRPVEPAAVRRRRDRLSPAGRVVLPGPGARAQRRLPLQGLVTRPRPAGSTSSPPRSGTCAPRGPPCSTWRAPRPRPGRPQTIAQVKNVLRRLRAAGHGRKAAPLFVFDAGYSAAALADGLLGCPVHVLVRLAAGCVFYADPVTWEGKYGRPARRGAAVHCLEPADFAAAAAGSGPRGRKKPLPPNPEPDEALTLPDTPLYGTVRAEAWHGVHPLIHGDRGWFAGRKKLPVLPGTLVHVTVERLPDGRDPHRAMWLWHAGPGPLSLDELWRAYLARFDIEHAFKLLKGTLGLTAAKVRDSRAGRPLGPAPHGRARPAPARPAPGRRPPPALGETPRSRPAAGTGPGPPRVSQHPPRPGDSRPCRETLPPRARQAQRQQQRPAPRYLLPGEADMPRTANTTLTREKVKT